AMLASPLRAYFVTGTIPAEGSPVATSVRGLERGLGRLRRPHRAGAVAQDVRAAVVADRVEPALGVQPGAQVAVGDDDPFRLAQRTGDHGAPGRFADRRAAVADDLLALR